MNKLIALFAFGLALNASAETMKLYSKPHANPNPGCDVYTLMTLDLDAKEVTLVNRVSGMCELYVVPNKRSYTIENVQNDSGDLTIQGTDMNTGATIQIADHRRSPFEVAYAALVMVEESTSKGALYSIK